MRRASLPDFDSTRGVSASPNSVSVDIWLAARCSVTGCGAAVRDLSGFVPVATACGAEVLFGAITAPAALVKMHRSTIVANAATSSVTVRSSRTMTEAGNRIAGGETANEVINSARNRRPSASDARTVQLPLRCDV